MKNMGFEYAKHPISGEDLKGFRAHDFGPGLNGYAHFAIPQDGPAKQKSLKKALDTIAAHYERELREALDKGGLQHMPKFHPNAPFF